MAVIASLEQITRCLVHDTSLRLLIDLFLRMRMLQAIIPVIDGR